MKSGKKIVAVCLSALLAIQMSPQAAFAYVGDNAASRISTTATYSNDVSDGGIAADGTDQGDASESENTSGTGDASSAQGDAESGSSSQEGGEPTDEGASNDSSAAGTTASASNENQSAEQAASDAASAQSSESAFADFEELKTALGKASGDIEDDGQGITFLKASPRDLILLSNANPDWYKNAEIGSASSGDFDLTGSEQYRGNKLVFQGLGSKTIPFEGSLPDRSFILNRALFAGYKMGSSDASFKLRFNGKTQGNNLFADYAQGRDKDKKLLVSAQFGSDAVIAAPMLGEVAGSLTLGVSYGLASGDSSSNYTKDTSIATDGNAGLIARTVAESSSLTLQGISGFKPSAGTTSAQINITSNDGNAGFLVGEVAGNATFETCGLGSTGATGFNKISPKGTVTAAKGSAGGLVGKTDANASVRVTGDEVDLSDITIAGATSGGFIGTAEKACFNETSFGGKVTLPKKVGSTALPAADGTSAGSTTVAGGFIGSASFAGEFTFPDSGKVAFPEGGIELSGNGTSKGQAAGGLFGVLELHLGVTLDNRNDISSSAVAGKINYGGVAGYVILGGEDNAAALTVIDSTVATTGGADKTYYYGGLVGWIGNSTKKTDVSRAALVVRNAQAVSNDPGASRGFGGAAGCVDTATVDLGSFKLSVANGKSIDISVADSTNGHMGGVVAEMWEGSVLHFAGTTDLSDALFNSGDRTGQLVGLRVKSLIYADGTGTNASNEKKGWTYIRPTAVELDDIATSGEVIRLSNDLTGLITLDEKQNARVGDGSSITGSDYTISGIRDFARLAIAWQTGDMFITAPSNLNITFAASVDLSGTGFSGFTSDNQSDGYVVRETPTFSGSITGASNTVTLAIGEPYGMRGNFPLKADDSTEGNGKIYRHDRLGLFASMSGSASSLSLRGSINFSAKKSIDAGTLAADLTEANAELNGVVSEVTVNADGSNSDQMEVNLGGLYGCMRDSSGSLSFASFNEIKSNIKIKSNAQQVVCGGAIGAVDASCPAKVTVANQGLSLSGSISATNQTSDDQVPVGGLVGVIHPAASGVAKRTVEIKGLSVRDFSLEGKTSASAMGGLLGFLWADTEVSFSGAGLAAAENVSVSASGNAKVSSLGGLVYRASGKWSIGNNGIDLSGFVVNNVTGQLGLLVCQGGPSDSKVAGNRKETSGLYLESTAPWNDAYKINTSICGKGVSASQFDEWVASTVDVRNGGENNVLASGLNGAVSLRTDTGLVSMDGTSCNTYTNRTNYGKSNQTNVNTRYYYNLDKLRDTDIPQASANERIDTPQELMLWSAIKYVNPDLRAYLEVPGTDCSGSINDISGTLDMKGYGYYPVDIDMTSISVSDATIAFYNSEIEQSEGKAKNKKTSDASQHMSMHAGLFRNYTNNTSNESPSVSLKVENVTFSGTVGMMASGGNGSYVPLSYSGALVSGDLFGSSSSAGARNMLNVQIDGCTLDGVTVYGLKADNRQYAPVLINAADSYVDLNIKNVSANSYSNGEKAGTSLIGDFGKVKDDGTSDSTQITITFEQIGLSAVGDSALFTKASLLNRFAYASGTGVASASYNFMRDDKNKTFGQEIDRQSTEYSGSQLWFYDENTYKTDKGYARDGDIVANPDKPAFGEYLPYVYITSKTNDGSAVNHEIKVNQRFENLVDGCGSYGDPYVISSESKLQALADYIGDYTKANDGWQISIASDQSKMCKRLADPADSNETVYTYYAAEGIWRSNASNETLSNEVMHRYIQSCYIDLNVSDDNGKPGTLVLGDGFNGIGNSNNPFRGVLTSTNGTTVKISRSKGDAFNGLVQYAYGCVVTNLTISYAGTIVLASSKDDAHKAPGSFFGGVIGNVLGGDNIIENVTVDMAQLLSVSPSRMTPVGGYVGVICGGGVIFRGTESNEYGGNETYLYNNPVVGRVLDGYAFGEGASGLSDNTVRSKACNYKVNNINSDDTGIITTESLQAVDSGKGLATPTVVKDAQGLLILSAIINSGAAAGATNSNQHYKAGTTDYGNVAGSNAYYGLKSDSADKYSFGNANYGKVRNASYSYVGKPEEANAESDFSKSVSDDTLTPGSTDGTLATEITDFGKVNAPYLVSHYATDAKTMFVCGAGVNAMSLSFGDGDFDLSGYGTGYLGLSGRYISNACLSADSADYWVKDRITPHIAKIEGNGKTLKVSLDVQEYSDDDFFTLGVGGLGSYLLFTQSNIDSTLGSDGVYISNLTISGTMNHSRKQGVSQSNDAPSYTGVGAVAGIAAGDTRLDKRAVKLSNVVVDNAAISGFATAGGFFGNSSLYGYASGRVGTGSVSSKDMLKTLSTNKKIALQFKDCGFQDSKITGGDYAGGFIGCVNRNLGTGAYDNADIGVSNKVETSSNIKTGCNSTVSTMSYTEPSSSYLDAFLGGMFGYLNQTVDVEGSAPSPVKFVDVSASTDQFVYASGGIVGKLDGGAAGSTFSWVELTSEKENATDYPKIGTSQFNRKGSQNFNKGNDKAGGLIGSVEMSGADNKVTISDCSVSKTHVISREADGGCVGFITKGTIEADGLAVSETSLDGSYSGGFLGGVYNGISVGDVAVRIKNARFAKNVIGKDGYNAQWKASLGSLSGGISGDGRGNLSMSNVLLDSCVFLGKMNGSFRQGLICGSADNDKLGLISAAGFEVRLPSNTKASDYPDRLVLSGEAADFDKALSKSFVSFSNYNSKANPVDDRALVGGASQTSPYVVTSPVSDTSVKESESQEANDTYLFGDGANVEVARSIVAEKDNTDTEGFIYGNVGGQQDGHYSSATSFSPDSSISTFNDNNPEKEKQAVNDFKVLQVSGSSASEAIESYLNVVTNGGFSDAKRKNSGNDVYVAASTSVYKLNNGVLVKSGETPNVTVHSSGTSSMGFDVSSGYDNGEGRFTLLTVTFSAAGNANAGNPTMTHTVVVPIVVRRQLEATFTATLNHGTPFSEASYANRGAGVRLLESYGNSSTALLTFAYNKALSESTEYGWDSYLAAGGSMGPVVKSAEFESNGSKLPAGTQFTLVDKDNGDHAYTYTLSEPASSIDFSKFTDTEGDHQAYSPKWMSELMGVTANKDKAGTWIRLDSSDGATAKAKDDKGNWGFYRPAESTDAAGDRFVLTCEKKKDGKEITPSENYYLVIYIPQSAGTGAINGSIQTKVSCEGVKIGAINYALRTDGSEDSHNSTASTYNFVSAYSQELDDQSRDKPGPMVPDRPSEGAGRILHMKTVDTVTAGANQLYTENDALYYRLDASLSSYENDTFAGASGFPAGTSGTANFYVYREDASGSKTYYQYDSAAAEWKEVSGRVAASTVPWTSDGSTMSLELGKDLAQIRQMKGSFCIETEMDVHLSEDAYKAAIAPSQKEGKDAYTILDYRASLADSPDGLKSSSMVESKSGEAKYYREDTGVALISLAANQTKQLGINLDDLNSAGDGNIGATGIYDMTGLTNGDETIGKAAKIVYTLTLEKRSGTDGSYQQVSSGIKNYFTVESDELGKAEGGDGSFTWADDQAAYGKFRTKDSASNKFKLNLRVKVDTTLNAHEYANYRLRLTAQMLDAAGNVINEPWNKLLVNQPDTPGAHSDYITYTLTRVKLDGIEGKAS